MQRLELIFLVFKIALRNIWLYRFRTVVIASLLGMGAFLGVLGLTLLTEVRASVKTSIVASTSGHAQVYSSLAKDSFSLFGGTFMGREDIGTLPHFEKIRDALMTDPNVKAVVPMGFESGILSRGNEMDDAIDALRVALKEQDPAVIQDRRDQVKFRIQQLRAEAEQRQKVVESNAQEAERLQTIAKAEEPGFIDHIELQDEDKLQFLETKIAPLSGEKSLIYLMYLGTDIELFQQNFPKFKIVEGQSLPVGERGILIAHKTREDMLKNSAARLLDKLFKKTRQATVPIKDDPETERLARDLPKQVSEIMNFIDRKEAESLQQQLSDFGIKPATDKGSLIEQLTGQMLNFLQVNDDNLAQRRAWFYEHIAPLIKLYQISPGETIIMRSYTRSGYLKSVPLKVYGVYTFEGLEDSDLAGSRNIVDLVSFRELYGQMTAASQQELAEMRAKAAIKDVKAEDAEAALFGDGSVVEERREASAPEPSTHEPLQVQHAVTGSFDPSEVKQGLALSTAVILHSDDKLSEKIQKLQDILNAGQLNAKIVDWQSASGMAGQFVNIVSLVLVIALLVIFVVALVIINNSIIVSTINRTREIGTMRAIGAQRGFVTGLFLAETCITGLVGTVVGGLAALFLLFSFHTHGIPSNNDIVTFLFSGPRLFPAIHGDIAFLVPLVVTGIATIASQYAARFAAKVRPAEAMQEKE